MQIDSINPFVRYLNWDPSPFIKASIVLHVVAIAVAVWHPTIWHWALGAVLFNHVLFTAAGLWPRSTVLGPNMLNLPTAASQRGEVAITIDDGPDPDVTPQVLDILDRHNAKATFFCIGTLAERYPDLCRDIVHRGHAIENHSQHHKVLFSMFGPFKMYREVKSAQDTLTRITGQAPGLFRPSAGLRNPFLDPVLSHLGLKLVSWSRRGFDTQETNPDVVLEKLTRGLKGGDILLLHDGNAARTQSGTPVILEVLPRLLDDIAHAKLRAVTLRAALA